MSENRMSPIEYANEVLAVSLVPAQREVLMAAVEHRMLAVASGHKTGMTFAAAVLASWFYAEHTPSRVIIVDNQSQALIHSLLNLSSGRVDRSTFVYAPSDRQEWFAGLSASHRIGDAVLWSDTLILVDNAENVTDATMDAIEWCAKSGGVRVAMFGHLTGGAFVDIITGKRAGWRTMRMSSEDTPNVKAGKMVVPGLATLGWVMEKRNDWGPGYSEHPLYRSRILGELLPREFDA